MTSRSPAHGFCDDEETRRLLRSRPPRQALAWAAACLGGPVVGVLPGFAPYLQASYQPPGWARHPRV